MYIICIIISHTFCSEGSNNGIKDQRRYNGVLCALMLLFLVYNLQPHSDQQYEPQKQKNSKTPYQDETHNHCIWYLKQVKTFIRAV